MDISSLLAQVASHPSAPLYLLAVAFFAGVLVSFTPCIYPMIPITAGILQTQASKSLFYNFLSSLVYVIGIATVYAFLGYLSATTSIMFGSWLGAPWFLIIMISFFLYLAFSMFGFYELYIPPFLLRQSNTSGQGSLLHMFTLGVVSGTVASPCLTPALAMLLGIVAKQGNPILGVMTLFSFALGMGILLILVGTFSSTLNMLPQAGAWMEEVKKLFGFLMLGICIYFLHTFLTPVVAFSGYTLIACSACFLFFKEASKEPFARFLAILSLLCALATLAYAIKLCC
ncbi:hypothetical protein FJ365_03555 [Candidatus Dependentiae bacterium]|nr:hypothetical protein [Candidatus Dependentiae bacterium]